MQETLGSQGSTSGDAKECVAGTEAWGAEDGQVGVRTRQTERTREEEEKPSHLLMESRLPQSKKKQIPSTIR